MQKRKEYQIYSIDSQLIQSGVFQNTSISLPDLRSGIYLFYAEKQKAFFTVINQ